ncbi:MAG: hypothetical protein V1489_02115 [Candidatus Liptonbacteria bacterium]
MFKKLQNGKTNTVDYSAAIVRPRVTDLVRTNDTAWIAPKIQPAMNM